MAVVEEHLARDSGTLAFLLEQARRGPDPAKVEHMARQISAAREKTAPAVQPVRGVALSKSELERTMVPEHRKIWILMAIRKRYDTGWLPVDVVRNIVDYRYDRQAEEVLIVLRTGALIRDGMTRITLEGRVDEIGVDELVATVSRRGWERVDLTGSLEFQRAAALCLASLDPPIEVVRSDLRPEDLARIQAAVGDRREQTSEFAGMRM